MNPFEGELQIDQPITDLTGTVCQPGLYEVMEFEQGWWDRETGDGSSPWVWMVPVAMTTSQVDFFTDHFPERYTFDPDAVVHAFEEGRTHQAREREMEDAQARAWEAEQKTRVVECGCELPAMVRDDGTCSGCGAQVVQGATA